MQFVVVLCAAVLYLGYYSCAALPLAEDPQASAPNTMNLTPNITNLTTSPSGMSVAAGASADPIASALSEFQSFWANFWKPFTGQFGQTS